MRLKRTIAAAAAALATLLPTTAMPASAASTATDCQSFVTGQLEVDVPTDVVASACREYEAQIAASTIPEIPTLLMAWPGVGVTNDAGEVGFPVSGVCVLGGVIAGVGTVQYVLAGSAQSVGPATSTRIACTAGPLATDSTIIGPASATATTAVAPLQSMSVCTLAVGKFLDGSTTRSKTPAGCSLKPSSTQISP